MPPVCPRNRSRDSSGRMASFITPSPTASPTARIAMTDRCRTNACCRQPTTRAAISRASARKSRRAISRNSASTCFGSRRSTAIRMAHGRNISNHTAITPDTTATGRSHTPRSSRASAARRRSRKWLPRRTPKTHSSSPTSCSSMCTPTIRCGKSSANCSGRSNCPTARRICASGTSINSPHGSKSGCPHSISPIPKRWSSSSATRWISPNDSTSTATASTR